MRYRLKPLREQVIVITGASSGIGLTTARLAAARGARVVLAARNGEALAEIGARFAVEGHRVAPVVADVAEIDDVRRLAAIARERFGGIDTWVNNAGVSVFGRLDEVPLEDQRQIFETNYWGVVHGSLVAIEELKDRGGGALINIGSELSDVAIPLQGAYVATKHAVKGFTDALRMELAAERANVSVTLVKPASIDTMFVPHAGNYMDVEPKLPAPLYAPEVVAEAILYAAQHPKRDVYAGGASKLASLGYRAMPGTMGRLLTPLMIRGQRTARPASTAIRSTLYRPGIGAMERQGQPGHVCESSFYTRLTTGLGR